MRKIFSLMLTLLLCFSFSVTASAATIPNSTAQPYYEKANAAESKLYINGTTATCESSAVGNSDVVKITAVQTLERQGFLWIWSTYGDPWTETAYTNSITMSNTMSVSGGKYRLKTVFTLTDSQGKSETITVYSSEQSV